MTDVSSRPTSVCVYCGASDLADPAYLEAAAALGRALAENGVRLVYGGGGVGLMGACARAARDSGGEVLGVMPAFLEDRERVLETVETRIVGGMHERKRLMYEAADGFIALPGGVGTLEEVVELLSWRRLDLHAKPTVFYNPGGFWSGLFDFLQRTIDERLTPAEFAGSWRAVEDVGALLPTLREMGLGGEPLAAPV